MHMYVSLRLVSRQLLGRDHIILHAPPPFRYSAVIMDEAHERSLNTDVLFGILKQIVGPSPEPNRALSHRRIVQT